MVAVSTAGLIKACALSALRAGGELTLEGYMTVIDSSIDSDLVTVR